MPNLRSGYKRIRQDKKRRLRNQAVLTELKILSRDIERLFQNKNIDEARKKIHFASRRLDQAAGKGIIPKGRASRRKSRLALCLARLESAKT